MQQPQDDRYARVLAVLNEKVEKTHQEFQRLLRKRDLEEDEDSDARMQLAELCLDAECDYRNAVAQRDQMLAIT